MRLCLAILVCVYVCTSVALIWCSENVVKNLTNIKNTTTITAKRKMLAASTTTPFDIVEALQEPGQNDKFVRLEIDLICENQRM